MLTSIQNPTAKGLYADRGRHVDSRPRTAKGNRPRKGALEAAALPIRMIHGVRNLSDFWDRVRGGHATAGRRQTPGVSAWQPYRPPGVRLPAYFAERGCPHF